VLTGKKVAGLYDHTTGQDLRIAAEARGDSVQGFDGDRAAKFGGTLPELHDAADQTFISCTRDGATMRGHDRGSSTAYTARVEDNVAQVFDHGQNRWFSYDVLDPAKDGQYYRAEVAG